MLFIRIGNNGTIFLVPRNVSNEALKLRHAVGSHGKGLIPPFDALKRLCLKGNRDFYPSLDLSPDPSYCLSPSLPSI